MQVSAEVQAQLDTAQDVLDDLGKATQSVENTDESAGATSAEETLDGQEMHFHMEDTSGPPRWIQMPL